ncbi:hypothetical protein [Natrinema halophilum]|uniref:hypothetical protein n=1 Tax=Natrinema halophilum TaxID=1699371 RepID=UPI001F462C68|nr:hypothetical protein [Natrinema halophilum]UHQ96421.1 hypothetical protein HYG82_23560 [Natrinema halophilum]
MSAKETVEERWQKRLTEARVQISDGLQPELLAKRYGAETTDEIAELTQQATKEMIRGGHTLLTLDDLDVAEEKLEESGYEVATDGGVVQAANAADRCRICDDSVSASSVKSIDTVDPGPTGYGLMSGPVPLCNWCREYLEAPTGEGCIVCGSDDTHHSFEIEGVAGVDDLDVYYGGSLCTRCSRDLVFDLQQRALSKQSEESGRDTEEKTLVTDGGTDIDDREIKDEFVQEYAVPVDEAESFVHVGYDDAYHPTGGYWFPTGQKWGDASGWVSRKYDLPEGELIQYPCDDRPPEILGYDDLPGWVVNRALPEAQCPLVVVSCAGCEKRYLKENATIPSETVEDGEVLDPEDGHKRCPYCGQTTVSSARVPVRLDFENGQIEAGADSDDDDEIVTDGGQDLGTMWYVVAEPQQDPARIVAGPYYDADEADRRASLDHDLNAEAQFALMLVHNIQDNDYNVEWADGVDRPEALVQTDGGSVPDEVREYLKRRQERGNSYVKSSHISNSLGVSTNAASDYLRTLEEQGELDRWSNSSAGTVWKITGSFGATDHGGESA